MKFVKRSMVLATAAALPLTFAPAAHAGGAGSADQHHSAAEPGRQDTPLDLDIDLNLDDTDDLRLGVRAITVDSDGGESDFDRFGTRAEIGLKDLEGVDTDVRAVQQDEDDGFSVRSILNLDDPDDIGTDVDATFLDGDKESEAAPAGAGDPVAGEDDEQSFEEDAAYVFGG